MDFASVYNDGIPSSVFYGMHPEHEVIQHIPDEAIEELFPPSADEVSLLVLQCTDSMVHIDDVVVAND